MGSDGRPGAVEVVEVVAVCSAVRRGAMPVSPTLGVAGNAAAGNVTAAGGATCSRA